MIRYQNGGGKVFRGRVYPQWKSDLKYTFIAPLQLTCEIDRKGSLEMNLKALKQRSIQGDPQTAASREFFVEVVGTSRKRLYERYSE